MQHIHALSRDQQLTLLSVCGKENLSGGWSGFCCGGNPGYSKHLILLDIEDLITFEIIRC